MKIKPQTLFMFLGVNESLTISECQKYFLTTVSLNFCNPKQFCRALSFPLKYLNQNKESFIEVFIKLTGLTIRIITK